MTENPYKTMTFDELKAVYADIQESEKNGGERIVSFRTQKS